MAAEGICVTYARSSSAIQPECQAKFFSTGEEDPSSPGRRTALTGLAELQCVAPASPGSVLNGAPVCRCGAHVLGWVPAPPAIERIRPKRLSPRAIGAWLVMGLSVLFGALLSNPAAAEEASPAYVFLIDDSGSMRGSDGKPPADPDRLAVFAVRALLQALDPADYATIVRLNEKSDARDASLPLLPLAEKHKRELLERVSAGGMLATYEGRATPCQDGFDRVTQVVRGHADRHPDSNVHVFYLTDGACTDAAGQAAIRSQLLAAAPRATIRLRLLTFEGREFTPWLETLAESLKGGRHPVKGDRPGGVLVPFADALGESRGRKPKVVQDPTQLESHQAASWVTVIAVAEDQGQDLQVTVTDGEGASTRPVPLERRDLDAGTAFRFAGSKRAFRLFVGRYKGCDAPRPSVTVAGATKWTLIQLADYRLKLDLRTYTGVNCLDFGRKLAGETNQVPLGQDACVVVRVLDAHGQVVRGLPKLEVGVDDAPITDARDFDERQAGAWVARGAHQKRIISSQCAPDRAECRTTLRCEASGRIKLHPWVTMQTGEAPRIEIGPGGGIDCIDDSVRFAPGELAFGGLVRPGTRTTDLPSLEARVDGQFSDARASFQLTGQVPGCVHVRLNGKLPGETFTVTSGVPLVASIVADPWCGPHTTPVLDFQVDGTLRLRAQSWNEDKPIHFRVKLQFQNVVTMQPTPLALQFAAGDPVQTASVTIGGNHLQPVEFKAKLLHRGWPGADDLRFGLANEAGTDVALSGEGDKQGPVRSFRYLLQQPLRLAATSSACCSVGKHKAILRLTPNAAASGSGKAEAFDVPVQVDVTSGSWVWCLLPYLLAALAVLAFAYLLLFIWRLVHGVHRLDEAQLVQVLRSKVSRITLARSGVEQLRPLSDPDEKSAITIGWQHRQGAFAYFQKNIGDVVGVGTGRGTLHEATDIRLGGSESNSKIAATNPRWEMIHAPAGDVDVALRHAKDVSIVAFAKSKPAGKVALVVVQRPGCKDLGPWTLTNGEASQNLESRPGKVALGDDARFRDGAIKKPDLTAGWDVQRA